MASIPGIAGDGTARTIANALVVTGDFTFGGRAAGNSLALNGASFGGLKVVTEYGWFAARPSGTEDVYKLYAESFRGMEHLRRIQEEAQALISTALAGAAG